MLPAEDINFSVFLVLRLINNFNTQPRPAAFSNLFIDFNLPFCCNSNHFPNPLLVESNNQHVILVWIAADRCPFLVFGQQPGKLHHLGGPKNKPLLLGKGQHIDEHFWEKYVQLDTLINSQYFKVKRSKKLKFANGILHCHFNLL